MRQYDQNLGLINPCQSESIGKWCLSPIWEICLNTDSSFNTKLLQEIIIFYQRINDNLERPTDLVNYDGPVFNQLKKMVLQQIRDCYMNFSQSTNVELEDAFPFEIRSAWLNMLPPGESISTHVHPNSAINATYYFHAPEACGDIVIIDTQDIAENPNSGIAKVHSIKPKESHLIFFPAYVLHKVNTNQSNEVRISLTFDLQFVDSGVKNTSNATAQTMVNIYHKYYPTSET